MPLVPMAQKFSLSRVIQNRATSLALLRQTLDNFLDEADAKAEIIVWHAQKGYTDLSVTSDNFTPDMENFDSLYCLP